MSEGRNPRLYLEDILDSGQAILEFTVGMDFETFTQDRKTSSAVIREFEIIGEAVGKLPKELKANFPQIEWQDISDFRNLLIHEYFGIDREIVWRVIQEDLTKLLETTRKILADLPVEPPIG